MDHDGTQLCKGFEKMEQTRKTNSPLTADSPTDSHVTIYHHTMGVSAKPVRSGCSCPLKTATCFSSLTTQKPNSNHFGRTKWKTPNTWKSCGLSDNPNWKNQPHHVSKCPKPSSCSSCSETVTTAAEKLSVSTIILLLSAASFAASSAWLFTCQGCQRLDWLEGLEWLETTGDYGYERIGTCRNV